MKFKSAYYPQEYRALTRLGVPIIIGQLGMTLQGLSDTIMLGQHSTTELAAAGFVNSLFNLALLLCMGYSFGAISQIGSYYSQGKYDRITSILKSSFVANALQGLLITICLVLLYFNLENLGQPEELVPDMRTYLLIILPSFMMIVLANTFKIFSDTINDTRTSMWIMLVGNVWNIVFNYFLIYGTCGFPEMGIAGAAWATFTSRVVVFLLFAIIFFGTKHYDVYRKTWKKVCATKKEILFLNRLGWPIAIQVGMEAASFSLCAILLGWVGTSALAAHQIMSQVAFFIYLFYIGIGSAVSIRVSNFNGLGDSVGVRTAANAGYQMILLVGIVNSCLVYLFRYDIAHWFTDNAEVTSILVGLMLPLMLYQLGDGLQTNYSNALRGLGDVKMLIRYAFLAYIVISLPLSYLFGITMQGGAYGIWMAFPFGLNTAGVLYLLRFRKIMRLRLSPQAA